MIDLIPNNDTLIRENRPCWGGLAKLKHTRDMKESRTKVERVLSEVKDVNLHSQMIGKKFGRYTVKSIAGTNRGNVFMICECDCGEVATVFKKNLIRGLSKSCGCLASEMLAQKTRKHGLHKSPEYAVWAVMKYRCGNKNSQTYSYYGGRGISVCERWMKFENFISDMGQRPSRNHSLDRIDNDGNYEPGNCRWATRYEQSRNKRQNIFMTVNGETKCLTDWESTTGISRETLRGRIKRGWTPEHAISVSCKTGPNYESK